MQANESKITKEEEMATQEVNHDEETSEQKFNRLDKLLKSEDLSFTALATFKKENSNFLGSVTKAGTRSLLWRLCRNYKVTLEMIQFLLMIFPEAADADVAQKDKDFHATALIAACSNPFAEIEIIQHLIIACPEALKKRASYGELPIHAIFHRSIVHKELKTPEEQRKAKRTDESIYSRYEFETPPLPMDIMELLVSQCPETLLQEDENKKLPIHILCENESLSLEALKLLVEAAPESLRVRGGYDRAPPLYCLLKSHHYKKQLNLEMVRYLAEKEPEQLRMLCGQDDDSLSLHVACKCVSGETQAPIVRFLLDSYPESIHFNARVLPLHEACLNEKGSTLECIQCLVEAHPQAVTTQSAYGFKPTEYAVRRHGRDVLEYLIRYDSEIASRPDRRGSFLLHSAATNPHVDSLEFVYNLNPIAIEQPDDKGNLPLHAACAWGEITAANLEFLVSKFSQAAKKQNREGMFPLHLLCSSDHAEKKNLAIVHSAFTEAIKSRNNKGHLPFHSSCAKDYTRVSALQNVHALYPEAAGMVDSEGNLPLHLVAKASHFSDKSARFIYKLHPDHISVENHMSEIPLHLLMRNEICEEFFDELVRAFPEGLGMYHETLGFPLQSATSKESRAKDEIVMKLYVLRYGMRVFEILPLPFHVILQDRTLGKVGHSDIVRWFLSKYGCAILCKDRQGRTPFHFAVATELKEDVFNKFLEADPDAVRVKDKHGSLPLHYCLRHGDPNGVALKLLDLYPESIRIGDCQGFLPIHNGCRKGAPFQTIKQILERDCTQCLTVDYTGELPLHKSCRAGDIDVTRLLMTMQPHTVSVRNKEGALPFMLLCQSSGKLNGTKNGTESLDTIW
eukprot:CAMPEP_0194304358 /NCGR_PEP_ID=MMETSP0171-20130528/2131_1 /TAXON_ID=218684 /ORGANISM="Corethron pennatum, Strain L29A3" /LENGTH=851 /DNA_ID=CAMNT_0039055615 /DNA_START=405 /DNA_END=2957 /DNA_ORIENTATION=-